MSEIELSLNFLLELKKDLIDAIDNVNCEIKKIKGYDTDSSSSDESDETYTVYGSDSSDED